jgi:hypothetical protein
MLKAGLPYTTSSNNLSLAIKNLENEANQKNRGQTTL